MNRRRQTSLVAVLLILFLIFILSNSYGYKIRNAISYGSRPLWDTPHGPQRIIPHYYAEGIVFDERHCALHGWRLRDPVPEVWDAVLFNTELDLLEIRMRELDAVVDRFFIIESDHTFTGIPKAPVFSQNRDRFDAFSSKIVYQLIERRVPAHGETAFDVERDHRDVMTSLINEHIPTQLTIPPLVICSDVDEIPSEHTLRLIKTCASPSPMHLQMRNFLYSFEWPYGWGSWRAQIHEWGDQEYYKHSQTTDIVLADAGWHCSFCFRFIEEFVTKMKGFSHADRIGGDTSLLSPERIQKVICEGTDIFNMLPEAYSYKDMLSLMHPDLSSSAVGLPLHLIRNAEKFRFLLPGGCERDRDG